MSGRKIVGSAAEGLISILYCESPWAVSWSPPTQKWRMAARGGGRWKRGCGGPDGGCGKSRKTASQRRARCWGWGGRGERTGEVLEGSRLPPWNQAVWGNWVQVQRQSPRLNDEVMKTKWILSDFNCVYVNSPRLCLSLPVTWKLKGDKPNTRLDKTDVFCPFLHYKRSKSGHKKQMSLIFNLSMWSFTFSQQCTEI